jgi:hypothetical protein
LKRKENIGAAGVALLVPCSTIAGINLVIIKIVNAGLQPVFLVSRRPAAAEPGKFDRQQDCPGN